MFGFRDAVSWSVSTGAWVLGRVCRMPDARAAKLLAAGFVVATLLPSATAECVDEVLALGENNFFGEAKDVCQVVLLNLYRQCGCDGIKQLSQFFLSPAIYSGSEGDIHGYVLDREGSYSCADLVSDDSYAEHCAALGKG